MGVSGLSHVLKPTDRCASVRLVFAGPRLAVRCDRRDSNPHGLPHQLLRLARLPIPPRSRTSCEMYLSRVPLSSQSSFWSHLMFRMRVCSIVLAVALGATVSTRPAAAQASQDRDKFCRQVQNRTLAVGTWATYKIGRASCRE